MHCSVHSSFKKSIFPDTEQLFELAMSQTSVSASEN